MKKNVHPKYQQVLFIDSATGHRFLCGSTLQSEHKETFEGKQYPVAHVSISSASHPFFTGSKQLVDAEGRVDKFKKRYMKHRVEEVKEEQQKEEQPSETEAKDSGKKGSKSK
jgi:large subunit ribosomal protein L31